MRWLIKHDCDIGDFERGLCRVVDILLFVGIYDDDIVNQRNVI